MKKLLTKAYLGSLAIALVIGLVVVTYRWGGIIDKPQGIVVQNQLRNTVKFELITGDGKEKLIEIDINSMESVRIPLLFTVDEITSKDNLKIRFECQKLNLSDGDNLGKYIYRGPPDDRVILVTEHGFIVYVPSQEVRVHVPERSGK